MGTHLEIRLLVVLLLFVCIYMCMHVGRVMRKSRVKFRCHFWRAWDSFLPGAQHGYPDCPMGIIDLLVSVSLGNSKHFFHVGLTFLCGLCILNSGSHAHALCCLVLCDLCMLNSGSRLMCYAAWFSVGCGFWAQVLTLTPYAGWFFNPDTNEIISGEIKF